MTVVHAYHCYVDGAWEIPVQEHLWALRASSFDGPVILGLVGGADQRAAARRAFEGVIPVTRTVEAETGWEQVTLKAVRSHARAHSTDKILYCHSKGASSPSPMQDQWRRTMTSALVCDWKHAANLLDDGLDAVGCHWLTPDIPCPLGIVNAPMFGGNFWMASCRHLRRLDPVASGSRHDAEVWVGSHRPRVFDLLPGWPPSDAAFKKLGRLVVPA